MFASSLTKTCGRTTTGAQKQGSRSSRTPTSGSRRHVVQKENYVIYWINACVCVCVCGEEVGGLTCVSEDTTGEEEERAQRERAHVAHNDCGQTRTKNISKQINSFTNSKLSLWTLNAALKLIIKRVTRHKQRQVRTRRIRLSIVPWEKFLPLILR